MKYTNAEITFREFPDEISLCINISNCPFHCEGCHSPELWEDIGIELTWNKLQNLIESNKGITLVGFMGGHYKDILPLIKKIDKFYPKLKKGWYTGNKVIPNGHQYQFMFDYIKTGPYIKALGGLDSPITNQKMWEISKMETGEYVKENVTFKFWNNENNK